MTAEPGAVEGEAADCLQPPRIDELRPRDQPLEMRRRRATSRAGEEDPDRGGPGLRRPPEERTAVARADPFLRDEDVRVDPGHERGGLVSGRDRRVGELAQDLQRRNDARRLRVAAHEDDRGTLRAVGIRTPRGTEIAAPLGPAHRVDSLLGIRTRRSCCVREPSP
jgi:hypothetical protein